MVSKPPDRINAAAILVKNCKIMVKICHNWNPLKLRITSRTYFRIIFIISKFQVYLKKHFIRIWESDRLNCDKIKQKFCHLYFSSWKLSKIHYWTNKTVHRIKDKHPWFSSEKNGVFRNFYLGGRVTDYLPKSPPEKKNHLVFGKSPGNFN